MANILKTEKKVAIISMLAEGSSICAISRITGVHGDTIGRLAVRVGQTVPVHEIFNGQTVWKGEVEVFDLNGHPKAQRAYGWSHRQGHNDEGERFVTVLEIPPVESAVTAVRVSIVADAKKRKAK